MDNFNGASICGESVKVDHVREYHLSKEFTDHKNPREYFPTGPDGRGWASDRRLSKEEEAFRARQAESKVKKAVDKNIEEKQTSKQQEVRVERLRKDKIDSYEASLAKQLESFRKPELVRAERKLEALQEERKRLMEQINQKRVKKN